MSVFDKACEVINLLTGIDASKISGASTVSELKLTKLDVAELILELEETFDVVIDDEQPLATLNDIIGCVNTQICAA